MMSLHRFDITIGRAQQLLISLVFVLIDQMLEVVADKSKFYANTSANNETYDNIRAYGLKVKPLVVSTYFHSDKEYLKKKDQSWWLRILNMYKYTVCGYRGNIIQSFDANGCVLLDS